MTSVNRHNQKLAMSLGWKIRLAPGQAKRPCCVLACGDMAWHDVSGRPGSDIGTEVEAPLL